MTDYIKREDAEQAILECPISGMLDLINLQTAIANIDTIPSADVVEAGIVTCFGIKFVMEDDIIKVKWRHGDKHYIVPFGGLLELWEKYKEREHE